MYVENIVIGKPICEPELMFATNHKDWENAEKEKTFYTEERFLPKILVELGIYPSISEIRRNRKDLMITFDKPDFIDGGGIEPKGLKVSKKRKLWILVGE